MRDADADLAGGDRCATSAWSIRAASMVPATAAPGNACAIRIGVASCAIKVSELALATPGPATGTGQPIDAIEAVAHFSLLRFTQI